ncbi:MAG: hypothetical protein K9K75_04940, partial [Deltaproteobacteria bacterium]|nr:hypothetical protein [Deltaproteobacteria bacterium]
MRKRLGATRGYGVLWMAPNCFSLGFRFLVHGVILSVFLLLSHVGVAAAAETHIKDHQNTPYNCTAGSECWLWSNASISGNFNGTAAFRANGTNTIIYNCGTVINGGSSNNTGGILASNGGIVNNTATGVIRLSNALRGTMSNPGYGLAAVGNGSTVYHYGDISICGTVDEETYYFGIFVNGSGARAFVYGNITTQGNRNYGVYVANGGVAEIINATISGMDKYRNAPVFANGPGSRVTIFGGTTFIWGGTANSVICAVDRSTIDLNATGDSWITIHSVSDQSYEAIIAAYGAVVKNYGNIRFNGSSCSSTSIVDQHGLEGIADIANNSNAHFYNYGKIEIHGYYGSVRVNHEWNGTLSNYGDIKSADSVGSGLNRAVLSAISSQSNPNNTIDNFGNITVRIGGFHGGMRAGGGGIVNNTVTGVVRLTNTTESATLAEPTFGLAAYDAFLNPYLAKAYNYGNIFVCGSTERASYYVGVYVSRFDNSTGEAEGFVYGNITTTGMESYGVLARNKGRATVGGSAFIFTSGANSRGFYIDNASGNFSGTVRATGNNSYGVYADNGSVLNILPVANISVTGSNSTAVYASGLGTVVSVDANAAINANGTNSWRIYATDFAVIRLYADIEGYAYDDPYICATNGAKIIYTTIVVNEERPVAIIRNARDGSILSNITIAVRNGTGVLANNKSKVFFLYSLSSCGTTNGSYAFKADNDSILTNCGSVELNGPESFGMLAINNGTVINENSLTLTGDGSAGISVDALSNGVNNASVSVGGSHSLGMRSSGGSLRNHGALFVNGTAAAGIYSVGGSAINSGNTTVTGNDSIGIFGLDGATIDNSGNITVTGDRSIGVKLHNASSFTNTVNIVVSGVNATGVLLVSNNFTNTVRITATGTGSVGIAADLSSGGVNNASVVVSGNNSAGMWTSGGSLRNHGALVVDGTAAAGIYSVGGSAINSGNTTVTGSNSIGIFGLDGATIDNSGNITVDGYGSVGVALHNASAFTNTVNIVVSGVNAMGVLLVSNDFTNTVRITATGAGSVGIAADLSSGGANNASVVVSGSNSAGMWTSGGSLRNHGALVVDGTAAAGIYSVGGSAINSGNTTVTGNNSIGVWGLDSATIANSANITVDGYGSVGVALENLSSLNNTLSIVVSGVNSTGVFGDNSQIVSSGSIAVSGVCATGIHGVNGSALFNSGNISATGTGSRGVFLVSSNFTNTGRITATDTGTGMDIRGNSTAWNNASGVIVAESSEAVRLSEDAVAYNHGNINSSSNAALFLKGFSTFYNYGNISSATGSSYAAVMATEASRFIQAGNTISHASGVAVAISRYGGELLNAAQLISTGSQAPGMLSVNSSRVGNNGTIITNGSASHGMVAEGSGSLAMNYDGAILVSGFDAHGMVATNCGTIDNLGNITVTAAHTHGMVALNASAKNNGSIITTGVGSHGVEIDPATFENFGVIETSGDGAYGINVYDRSNATNFGTIKTSGAASYGVYLNGSSRLLNYGNITTSGYGSHGVMLDLFSGAPSFAENYGNISALGADSYGVLVRNGTFFQSGGSVSGLKGSIFAEHHSTVTYSGGEFVGVIGGDNSSALLLAAAAGVTVSGVVEGFGVLSGVGAGIADISGSVGSVSWDSGSLSIGAGKRLTVGGNYTQHSGSLVFNPTYSDYYQLIFNGTVSFGSLSNVHVETASMLSSEVEYLYAISSESPSGSFSFSYNNGGGAWFVTKPEWVFNYARNRHELGGNFTEVIPSSPAATIAATYGHQGSWLLMDAIGGRLLEKVTEETPQNRGDIGYHFGSFAASGSKGSATESDSSYDSSQSGVFVGVERALSPNKLLGAFYGYTQRSIDFTSVGLDKEKIG